MKFKLNLGKFKKVHADEGTTTMQHEDGHVMKIAHKSLSPKMRKELESLPTVDNKQHLDKGGEIDPKKAKSFEQDFNKSGWETMKEGFNNLVHPQPEPSPKPKKNYDKGGEIAPKGMVNNPNYQEGSSFPKYMPAEAASDTKGLEEPMIDPVSTAVGVGMAGSVAGAGSAVMNAVKNKATSNATNSLLEGIKKAAQNSNVKGEASKIGSMTGYGPGSSQVAYQKEMIANMPKAPKNYADGGEAVPEAPAAPESSVVPSTNEAQGLDPTLNRKRELYNQIAPIPSQFQPDGNIHNFDPLSWGQAEKNFAAEQAGQVESQRQDTLKAQAENSARTQAGLPPIPVPAMPEGTAPEAPAMTNPTKGPVAPIAPQGQQPQAPAQDPYGTQAYSESYMKGLNQQVSGIQGQAQAKSAEAKQEAQALQVAQQKQHEIQNSFKNNYDDLEFERNAHMDDVNNYHVDPAKYWQDHSKLATGIGIILAGFNPTSSPNAAIEFLNTQMNRNLDAQKAELGKKENLLSANLKQFGNMRDAMDMTRVMQGDALAIQIKKAAAQNGSQMAQAQAQQMIGQLNQQAAPILAQQAMRRTLLQGAKSGHVDPAKVVNMIVPENQRADANKELIEAQNMASARDNVLSGFDKLAKINTVGGRMGSPLQTSKQVNAIKQPLVAGLSKATAGRFTEQDAGMLDSLFPAPGDNAETIAIKRNQAAKLISEKMHFPILETYGINIGDTGRYNNQGISRIQQSAPIIKK